MVGHRLPLLTDLAAPALAGAVVLWSFTRLKSVLPAAAVGPITISAVLLGLWGASVAWRLVRERRAPWIPASALAIAAFFLARWQPVEAVVAVLLPLSVARPPDLRPIRVALGLVVAILGIWGIVFVLTLEPTPYTALARHAGPVGDPNDLAQVVILSMLPALMAAPTARGRERWLALAVIALGVAAVFASHSRAAVVILVLIVAAIAARAGRTRPWLAVALVAGTAVGVALIPFKFWWRFFRLLSGEDTGHRIELARAAWRMFLEHPWLGVGHGNFPAGARGLTAHNIFTEVLAEGGLVLSAIFLVAMALLLRDAWRARAAAPGLALVAPLALVLAATGEMDDRVLALSLGFAPLTAAAVRSRKNK